MDLPTPQPIFPKKKTVWEYTLDQVGKLTCSVRLCRSPQLDSSDALHSSLSSLPRFHCRAGNPKVVWRLSSPSPRMLPLLWPTRPYTLLGMGGYAVPSSGSPLLHRQSRGKCLLTTHRWRLRDQHRRRRHLSALCIHHGYVQTLCLCWEPTMLAVLDLNLNFKFKI
jgi:hypothetical protein